MSFEDVVDIASSARRVAEAISGLRVVIAPVAAFASLVDELGLKQSDAPFLTVVDSRSRRFEPQKFTWGIYESELKKYAKSWIAGDINVHIKSGPLPDDAGTTAVVDIVGNTWEELVTKQRKNSDILIEFYAPWCGHCKNLAPVYEEVADFYAGNDKIVIAKIDATTNDLFEFKDLVRGFPTIYLLPAGDAEPIKYVR